MLTKLRWMTVVGGALSAWMVCGTLAAAQVPQMTRLAEGVHCSQGAGSVDVTAFGTRIVRVAVRAADVRDERTSVLDPALKEKSASGLAIDRKNGNIVTNGFRAAFDCAAQTLMVSDSAGHTLVTFDGLFTNAVNASVAMHRATAEPMYGMTGTDRNVPVNSIERPNGAIVRAGAQGNGGAPFFFTKSFGVLVDSVDGLFAVHGTDVRFEHISRKEVEFFVLVGKPMQTMSGLADLTGHAPMPPRWTLGFLNSQWGIDETELRSLAAHYRASHIPLDGFILDFDWKAWGEDNYGEWRWNSTNGVGATAPDKFPNGASGELARAMALNGIHLAGILKPRILLTKPDSDIPLEAAAYATAHGFWLQGEKPYLDYVTKRNALDIDFANPEARSWYWRHLEPSFDAGMAAWWNDEADSVDPPNRPGGLLPTLEHFNMGRALYEGQRAYSNVRVWSINRNYYLGAARYGYGEWSGDIKSGAQSMAVQPIRMLGTMNLGEPHWTMDTGGFRGNPTPEEYARWMEFAALTPIMRVHASHNQKRQPWIYGPVAEAAATEAIKLRYSLLPYIYSAEHETFDTGIGIVRPLEWVFPDDAIAAAQRDEWFFGDALLAAPVLDVNATERKVYLPAGTWTEYAAGKVWQGGQTIVLTADPKTLRDIPLFIREGSIVATEEPGDSTDAMRPAEIVMDVFPSKQRTAEWTMYDDDGKSYDYEKGVYFRQKIDVFMRQHGFMVDMSAAEGTFATSVRSYLIRLHGVQADVLRWNGKAVAMAREFTDTVGPGPSWVREHDRFGDGIEVRVIAGSAAHLEILQR
jgi:alpha-glucosidase